MELTKIIQKISTLTNIKTSQVEAVCSLTDEGCTIPFIARYRKERTGGLDEVQISDIIENIEKITELEDRREYILSYLEGENLLNDELKTKISKAETLAILEDLYLPFKPRKKTKADKAKELGLEPLARFVFDKNPSKNDALKEAARYIGEGVDSPETALSGAIDILTQEVSDNAAVRGFLREEMSRGTVFSAVKKGKKEDAAKYQDYFEFQERADKIASHRVMAILRGADEGLLNISVTPYPDSEKVLDRIMMQSFSRRGVLFEEVVKESYKRHLENSIGNEIISSLRERAEKESAQIFARNLEKILMSSPFGEKPVIGIDPGIRTGCKAALIDANGNFKEYQTLFLNTKESDAEKILPWIEKYKVAGIAIGDGTFGRETHKIISNLLKGKNIVVALVDEDGASIYSASETAREEFGELDLTLRGAISIGRRFQDPMAELVKIDPKSLGVGQYQHDINAKLLKEKLETTVAWAVNKVGVNLNTCSKHLLAFISGLDRKKAAEVINLRNEIGAFKERSQLKKVKGIGEKAFQQCAGFLRIKNGKNPLDATGVHPESYGHLEMISKTIEKPISETIEHPEIIDKNKISALKIPELDSLLRELSLKGLDPRESYREIRFREDISSINDLAEGMILTGVVDNVTAFGAFVDIGIKEKGLVHISEVTDKFIKDINSVLSVGDEVSVKVIGLDLPRKRISLSIRQA